MRLEAGVLVAGLIVSACGPGGGDGAERRAAAGGDGSGGESAAVVAEYQPADSSVARDLIEYATGAAETIETFFGAPFPLSWRLVVLPERAAFDSLAAERWGMPATECWMVGTATTRTLFILSPRRWRADCDHDPLDREHVREIVAHELVHVYHMQRNPSDEFEGADEVAWFAEGLATYVSGQLETGHAARAREAIEVGAAPARLVDAWSGPYRYGVSGSLAAFLDERLGRERFTGLLEATTQTELLSRVGMTEEETLAGWRSRVTAR